MATKKPARKTREPFRSPLLPLLDGDPRTAHREFLEMSSGDSSVGDTFRRALCAETLRQVVVALGPLSFDERRMVLAWAAEAHRIDPGRLGHTDRGFAG